MVNKISNLSIERRCLYITNLPRRVKEYELEDLFKKFGPIKDLVIVKDPFTKESRGFSFLTFETNESAKIAIEEMSGFELEGRRIVCEVAKRNKSRTSTPGIYLGPSSVKKMRSRYEERPRHRSRSRSFERHRYRRYDERSRSRSRSRGRNNSYSRRK
jgi:RNA recognition motif-containing protein